MLVTIVFLYTVLGYFYSIKIGWKTTKTMGAKDGSDGAMSVLVDSLL